MSKIRCILIEDEPLAAKILADYINQVPFLELEGSFRSAVVASEYLHDHPVDLIFLDIHLPKIKGMTFLKTLADPPSVIITTAYHQYAVEGFELNVTDYLLKPFSFERFLAAVNKIRPVKEIPKPNEVVEKKEFIFVNVQKKKVKILFSEIVYIESQREYVKIVTTKKEFVSKISTREVESLLPASQFKRIHRSFIVSVAKIESYTSEYVEANGKSIPIGRDYRHIIEEF